jgi:hypothetical protein
VLGETAAPSTAVMVSGRRHSSMAFRDLVYRIFVEIHRLVKLTMLPGRGGPLAPKGHCFTPLPQRINATTEGA